MLVALSFFASRALTANACSGTLHLLIANEWGPTLQDIYLCDDNGNCVIAGGSVESGVENEFDVTVNAGQHYVYTAHIYENDVDFYMDIYPQLQDGFIDDLYDCYSEGGDFISPVTYTISTTDSPSNGGTTSGGGIANCGQRVTVTATPASGYAFTSWTEGGTVVSTAASYVFTVTGNQTLVAQFSPIVSVVATTPTTSHSGSAAGQFTVYRTGPTTAALNVTVQATGTAVSGTDYQGIGTTVTIPIGYSSTTIPVNPYFTTATANQTVILTVQGGTGYAMGSPASDTVTIQPAPTVSIAATVPIAYEGSGDPNESSGDPGVFTITRVSSSTSGPLTVNVQASGTATADVDYPAINPQITIPAGANSVKVCVWPSQDNINDAPNTVGLSLVSGNYFLGASASATVSIHSDPAAPLADPKSYYGNSFITKWYGGNDGSLPEPTGTIPPDPAYITTMVDSPAATGDPISGYVDVPNGPGPFPLVLIKHGDSYDSPGFRYLCDSLASHGIIAVSVENSGDLDSFIEHIQQFAVWNNTVGHPLYGRVDTNRIMLVGHCSGGGLVAAAAIAYNGMVAGNPVKGIVGLDSVGFIGVTAGYGPVNFPLNFLYLNPTRGHHQESSDNYDQVESIDRGGNPTANANAFQALTWIVGGCHRYFSSDIDVDSSDFNPTISREDQQNVVKVYVGAMAQALLLGQPQYLKFLQSYRFAAGDLPAGVLCLSESQPPSRKFIDHFGWNANYGFDKSSLVPPLMGSGANSWSPVTAGGTKTIPYPFSSTYGWFQWTDSSQYFQVSFPGGLSSSGYSYLALRIGVDTTSPGGVTQHLKLITQDTSGNSASFGFSLPYPDKPAGWPVTPFPTLQTVRIPLHGLSVAGVNINQIASITLAPETAPSTAGSVVFDDIQLCTGDLGVPITPGPTQVTISTSPSPANGGMTGGDGTYLTGSSVTASAMPASGYPFINWFDPAPGVVVSPGLNTNYTFTANVNRALVANFGQAYTITTSPSPATNGTNGTAAGAGTFTAGSTVTVTATELPGCLFKNWTENGVPVSSTATYTFTVTGNRNLVANFQPGYRIVTSSLSALGGAGFINGPGFLSGFGDHSVWAPGSMVTVIATPDPAAPPSTVFQGWMENGVPVSSAATYEFPATQNRNLVAVFSLQ
jgi:hypothetical protein